MKEFVVKVGDPGILECALWYGLDNDVCDYCLAKLTRVRISVKVVGNGLKVRVEVKSTDG